MVIWQEAVFAEMDGALTALIDAGNISPEGVFLPTLMHILQEALFPWRTRT